jgi:hypothetical protein
MDNVYFLNKKYNRDTTVDDVVKIKMHEIIKEAIFTLNGYESYEMDCAKKHLEDSLVLALNAIEIIESNRKEVEI